MIMDFFRRGFPADTWLGRHLRLALWTLRWRSLKAIHPWVLDALARDLPNARFVQVGSNDAGYGDPLRYHILHSHWRGLMIEPLPFIFERLRSRYANIDGLSFENVAIDREPGERAFYHLRPDADPALPPWYDQLGSFLKDNVLKHVSDLPDIAERLVVSPVQCASVDEVCERNGIDQFDILHIDAEGYDAEILKTVDLARFQPTVVLFEHKHLSTAAYAQCLGMLHAQGYRSNADTVDTLAIREDALASSARLRQAWRRGRARLGTAADACHAGCV